MTLIQVALGLGAAALVVAAFIHAARADVRQRIAERRGDLEDDGPQQSLDEAIEEGAWIPPALPVKYALCIERDEMAGDFQAMKEAGLYDFPIGFWSAAPLTLEDRATCETDESLLQLLPYVVLITAFDHPPKVFTYSRGGAGAEARLHGNLSIGVGGHVDGMPPEHFKLRSWLLKEAQREVLEEVGLRVDPLALRPIALINDPTNAVGRVHLGILIVAYVNPADLGEHEAEIIEKGEWLTWDELAAHERFQRLENWSKVAVEELPGRGYC